MTPRKQRLPQHVYEAVQTSAEYSIEATLQMRKILFDESLNAADSTKAKARVLDRLQEITRHLEAAGAKTRP
jgi:hypothetical protein